VRSPQPMQDINLAISCMRLLSAHLDEWLPADPAAPAASGPSAAAQELTDAQVRCGVL
jgi:hypothetical protein